MALLPVFLCDKPVERVGSSPYLHFIMQRGNRIPPDLHADYAKCKEITTSHYENFPVGSVLAPPHLRPHIYSVYAFARTADDFADEPGLDTQERLDRLDEWQQRLNSATTSPNGPIFRALGHTVQTNGIPHQLLSDLLSAFRQDVLQNRHQTWDDLLAYASRSANPVGRIILHLFNYTDEDRATLSDKICTALQFANFWQDVAIDAGRNRIYLPQQDMASHGVNESDLSIGRPTVAFQALLADLCTRTQILFNQGESLPERVHGRLRYELRLTWLGGAEILNRIRSVEYDVFHRRPRIGRTRLLHLLIRSLRPLKALSST